MRCLCVVQWSDATDHLEAVLGALVWTAHSAAKGTVALNQDNQPFLEYNSKADNHRYTTPYDLLACVTWLGNRQQPG
jgi:hypothetical protein